MKFLFASIICCLTLGLAGILHSSKAEIVSTWYDYDGVELRALDKITARATTFKAKVGQTLRFGGIFIKVRACRKPSAVEKEESASFIQVWEKDRENDESHWVFSGWMFSSSPALSAMDHPIYDVWVLACTGENPEPEPEEEQEEENPETPSTEEDTEPSPQSDVKTETDKLIDGLLGDEEGTVLD